MHAGPHEVTAAVERLRVALDGMAEALASGDLSSILTAQEALIAARIPAATLRGWSDGTRRELRLALRRARVSLNGAQRTNQVLLHLLDDFLTSTEADYTRHGGLVSDAIRPRSDGSVSCRV